MKSPTITSSGARPDLAVVDDDARAVLADYDSRVEHFDVIESSR